TPRPWRQAAGKAHAVTVAKEAAHRGEHEGNRKTFARGRPGCFGCTCSDYARVRSFVAREAAGAVGARPSLRPLRSGGPMRLHNSGENRAAGTRKCVYRHCEERSDDPSTLAAQATPGWQSAEARRANAEAIQDHPCDSGLLRFARNDESL